MIKFEYKVSEFDILSLERELNKAGEAGWEAAFHSEVNSRTIRIVFKRPQVAGTLGLLS